MASPASRLATQGAAGKMKMPTTVKEHPLVSASAIPAVRSLGTAAKTYWKYATQQRVGAVTLIEVAQQWL